MSASNAILRLSVPSLGSPPQQRRDAVAMARARQSWLARLVRRRQPTTYQRFLAVHIHFAGPHSAMS